MERLTERYKDSVANVVLVKECGSNCCKDVCEDASNVCSKCSLNKVFEKLADYEDLEEQGLLLKLPCKIGDDVYIIPSKANFDLHIINGFPQLNKIYHQCVENITFSPDGWYLTSREELKSGTCKVCLDIFYKSTWFLSREEAEKKLKELENEV